MNKSFLEQLKEAHQQMNDDPLCKLYFERIKNVNRDHQQVADNMQDYKRTLEYALKIQRITSKFVDELTKKEQQQLEKDKLK